MEEEEEEEEEEEKKRCQSVILVREFAIPADKAEMKQPADPLNRPELLPTKA